MNHFQYFKKFVLEFILSLDNYPYFCVDNAHKYLPIFRNPRQIRVCYIKQFVLILHYKMEWQKAKIDIKLNEPGLRNVFFVKLGLNHCN